VAAPLSIVLATFGSEGDVRPLLWLGDGLAARGHRITVILTPFYRKFVDARPHWNWLPLGTAEDFQAAMRDPRLWQPRAGSEFVLQTMLDALPTYRALLDRVGERIDLVIGTTIATGAFTWAEAHGVPRLLVHLQPVCLRSTRDCPLYMEGLEWLCRAPSFIKRLMYALIDRILGKFLLPPLNAFRAESGLPPLHNVYHDIWQRATRIAALFPAWYCNPQPDWPAHLRQFNFPLSPLVGSPPPLAGELEQFLAAGAPPILWTHGSSNLDTAGFARVAVAASRTLGARCLLVALSRPVDLPPPSDDFLYLPHAPFVQLIHRCRAVVHHGGIGTLSQALAAGVPQLVVPRAHDQPDNARRLARLGVGATITYAKFTAGSAAAALRTLLNSPSVREACLRLQAEMRAADPLAALCDWVQEIASGKSG
jgi:rhamnosyltransferase subunit B